MHKRIAPFLCSALLLVALFWNSAYGFDCGGYTGTVIPLPTAEKDIFDKALVSIRNKDLESLLSVSDKQLLLVRRFVSGETSSRGGNYWVRLRPHQIDKEMGIHVGNQILSDFSDPAIFSLATTNSGIEVSRKICEKANNCNLLPFGDELERLLYGLLRCNESGKSIFVFADGVLLIHMGLITDIPIGEGLFFSKASKGYRLSSLIIMQ